MKDIEDEIPFAVPEGWVWCRLGEIYYHTTGKALKKSNKKGSLKKYITTSNLYWDSFDFSEVRSMYFTDEELDKYTIKKGDLVLCNGGDIGRAAIWNYDEDICYQNHVSRMRPKINGIENRFFLYVLMLYKEQDILNGKGIGISSLSARDLLSAIVPLPPSNQQKLIVSEIQKIFYQINLIEIYQTDLQTATTQAKSKILDLAIHGKLVPQDPADEPASVMLEKLRAEKETKIAAGEIKRSKNDSYIYRNPTDNCYYEKFDGKSDVCIDNEIPFELPANWQWQRGKEIFCPMTTKIPSGHNFRYIDIDAIDNKAHRIRCSKLIEVSKAPSRASREVQNGDILFSLVRPYLKNIALVLENYSDCIASTGFYVCRPNKTLISKYAFYMMTSQYVVNGLNKFMKGDNSPSITGDNIIKWLYPLPPISEQKRIVTRIEEIFNVLDDIQRDLI